MGWATSQSVGGRDGREREDEMRPWDARVPNERASEALQGPAREGVLSREGGTAALSTKPPVSDRHRGFLVKKREFGVISPGESEALALSVGKPPGRQRMVRQITAPNPPFLTEKRKRLAETASGAPAGSPPAKLAMDRRIPSLIPNPLFLPGTTNFPSKRRGWVPFFPAENRGLVFRPDKTPGQK